ncbi:hypothetical protein ACLBXX_07240, partial [Microbacterium sp. C23T]
MATFGSTVRRGLPRVPGGEPWPPAGAAPGANGNGAAAQSPLVERARDERVETPPAGAQPDVREVPAAVAATSVPEVAGADAATPAVVTPEVSVPGARAVRRGLPRVAGGEPWPPASVVPAAAAEVAAVAATDTAARPEVTPSEAAVEEKVAPVVATAAATAPEATPSATGEGTKALRRGLPRVAGGEPWPPAGFAPTATAA